VPAAIASSIDRWFRAILCSEAAPVGSEPNLEAEDSVHSSGVRYRCGIGSRRHLVSVDFGDGGLRHADGRVEGALCGAIVSCTALSLPLIAKVSSSSIGCDQLGHRFNQGKVGEGLGKVPEVLAGRCVDFLRVQLQWASVGEELLAQIAGPIGLADHG
jgi:hypothetical protein